MTTVCPAISDISIVFNSPETIIEDFSDLRKASKRKDVYPVAEKL